MNVCLEKSIVAIFIFMGVIGCRNSASTSLPKSVADVVSASDNLDGSFGITCSNGDTAVVSYEEYLNDKICETIAINPSEKVTRELPSDITGAVTFSANVLGQSNSSCNWLSTQTDANGKPLISGTAPVDFFVPEKCKIEIIITEGNQVIRRKILNLAAQAEAPADKASTEDGPLVGGDGIGLKL